MLRLDFDLWSSSVCCLRKDDWFNMRNLQLWVQDGYKTYRGGYGFTVASNTLIELFLPFFNLHATYAALMSRMSFSFLQLDELHTV